MNLSTKHSIRTTPKLGFTGLQVPITIRGEKYELLDQVSCCLAQLLKGKYREISDAAAAVAIVRGFSTYFLLISFSWGMAHYFEIRYFFLCSRVKLVKLDEGVFAQLHQHTPHNECGKFASFSPWLSLMTKNVN